MFDLNQATRNTTIEWIEILNFSSRSTGINNACTALKSEPTEDQPMSYEKTAHPTAPVEPAGEEDWGEDWGDVTAPTPDINQELEMYITELVVSEKTKDRVVLS